MEIVRKAGDKVPANLMKKWRQLRRQSPELLRGLHVMQQPAAFVDEVIYQWQQQLEAEQFKQILRQVDMFAGGWTETAQETNFLLRQLQGAVPAGCTDLGQITDIGFSKLGKDAAYRRQDEIREVMRLKARTEKVAPSYKCGAREIMEVAQAVHEAFVQENAANKTVLREYISAGWGAYRPVAGRMVETRSQPWAAQFPESSSRISEEIRQPRYEWLDQAGKPVLPVNQTEEQQIKPDELEVTYCPLEQTAEQAAKSVVMDMELGWLEGHEKQAALAEQKHPQDRTVEENYALAIARCTSQVRENKKQKSWDKAVLTREQRMEVWRQALGRQTIAARMSQLRPSASKSKAKKVKKDSKKKPGKGLSWARKSRKAAKKSAQMAKEKAAKMAAEKAAGEAAQEATEEAGQQGPLVGKTVRVVGWEHTGPVIQNQSARVLKHWQAEQRVRIQLLASSSSATQDLPESQVAVLPDKPVVSLPDFVKLPTLTHREQAEALEAAGNQVQFLQPGQLTESPELTACWREVLFRGRRQGDAFPAGRLVVADPQSVVALLYEFQAGNTDSRVWRDLLGQADNVGLWKELEVARTEPNSQCRILLPVHNQAGPHWTLLVLDRKSTQRGSQPAPWTARYYDSLNSQSSLEQAEALLALFRFLLPSQTVGGEPGSLRISRCRKQADNWSCGFWVLLWMETEYRELRGEGQWLLKADWPARRTQWNKFLAKLIKYQADKQPAGEAATKKAVEPVPAGSLAMVPLKKEPVEPVPAGSKQDETGSWGCSRCRHSQAGCLSCNPAKAMRWSQKGSEQAAK